jgi:hypothetical protein
MTDEKDPYIRALFDISPAYDDAPVFQQKVMMGLTLKSWLRQGLVVISGLIGGFYALTQFVRMPEWSLKGGGLYTGSIQMATRRTDATVEAGVEFIDIMARGLADSLFAVGGYVQWMQTPQFFWVSFALCSCILVLYLLNDAQERI